MVLCWFFNLIFFILSYFITFIIMGESVMGCNEIGLERSFYIEMDIFLKNY